MIDYFNNLEKRNVTQFFVMESGHQMEHLWLDEWVVNDGLVDGLLKANRTDDGDGGDLIGN